MQSYKSLSLACMLLALLIGAYGSLALAKQGPKVRFSNWEFDPMPLLQKVEQTADKLVYKLDKSVPGPGGTVTLQAGRPLKGTLAATLDAEWKRLTAGRKLAKPEPDDDTALADGTKLLRRTAMTANGGFFAITAFAAPNGVNLMLMDAADEMATQMLAGMTFGFFATVKLHPVGGPTALAKAGKAAAAKPAETPQEEMARLNREMMQNPQMQNPMGAMGMSMPQETAKPGFRKADPIPVPKLDKARIANIPSRVLSDQELSKHLRETVTLVEAKLGPQARATGGKLLQALNANKHGHVAIENAAIGLYVMGNLRLGLYLMGKAAIANSADANTINNYAAFLNMGGAEHRAVPILQNLEKKYPDNTTVLNNLGQAWFGLGDLAKAEKYLGRVVFLRPGHSQANFTRGIIDENRGSKQAATASMKKAMSEHYNEDSASQLERLGYEITEKDIPWNGPFKDDPMKLHKALVLVPPYYTKAKEVPVAKARWEAYWNAVGAMKEQVARQQPGLQAANERALQKFKMEMMSGRKRFSPLAMKFTLKYITFGRQNEELMRQLARWNLEVKQAHDKIGELREKMRSRLKANPNAPCGTREAIVTEFMSQANKILSNVQSEARIKARIRWFNEWAQILRYYNTPTAETHQVFVNDLKWHFLNYMAGLQHEHPDLGQCAGGSAASPRSRTLVLFEDIHCDRHISFTVPMIGVIRMNCHYLETEFDIAGVLKGSSKEDIIRDEFVRGTLEVGASKEIGKVTGGPVDVSVTAKGGAFIEIDSNGISDAGLEVGIESQVGAVTTSATVRGGYNSGVSATTDAQVSVSREASADGVSVGANAHIGVNSSAAVSGTGVLTGL